MSTAELIRALAADSRPERSLRRTLLTAMAVAGVAAALVWLALLGPRPDIGTAMHTPRFLFKFLVSAALAASAAFVAFPMAQPFDRASRARLLLLLAPVLLLGAVAFELSVIPANDWTRLLIGHNARVCLMSIPAIALVPLGVLLFALRDAAPARPLRTGAIAGLIAGGLAAFFYAAHCFDDSPLFVACWYTLGIGFVTLLGALVGARVLRW